MLIRLLDVDPDLGRGIDPAHLPVARRMIVGIRQGTGKGRWDPESAISDGVQAPFAALVVDGLMTRERALASATHAEIIGPGDVLDPWSPEPGVLAGAVIWTAVAPMTFAVLDRRFLRAVREWPSLALRLFERLNEQNTRTSMHAAINGIRKVEQRILAMLWHLADRYGKVTLDGVVVSLGLSHEAIGHLVGARRPTVTLALRVLSDQKHIRIEGKGGFVLLEGAAAAFVPAPQAGTAEVPGGIEALAPIPALRRDWPFDGDRGETRSNGTLRKGRALLRDSASERRDCG